MINSGAPPFPTAKAKDDDDEGEGNETEQELEEEEEEGFSRGFAVKPASCNSGCGRDSPALATTTAASSSSSSSFPSSNKSSCAWCRPTPAAAPSSSNHPSNSLSAAVSVLPASESLLSLPSAVRSSSAAVAAARAAASRCCSLVRFEWGKASLRMVFYLKARVNLGRESPFNSPQDAITAPRRRRLLLPARIRSWMGQAPQFAQHARAACDGHHHRRRHLSFWGPVSFEVVVVVGHWIRGGWSRSASGAW